MAYSSDYAHSGIAPERTLAVGVTTASDTTITLDSGTGWPSPTGGQLSFGVLNPDTATESKFTYTGRAGAVLSGVTFSTDGSTAAATYAIGVTVRHVFSAQEAGEANDAVRNTVGKITTLGDLLVGSAANALKRLGVGTARQSLVVTSGGTDLEYAPTARSVLTAAGDVLYASAANTLARLAKGSDGQVLTLASGLPSWAAGGSADQVFIPAGLFETTGAGPARGYLGGFEPFIAWMFDAALSEYAGAQIIIPTGWSTVDIDLWWSTNGAGSGDVVWVHYAGPFADGATAAVPSGNTDTITAPAQNVIKKSPVQTGLAVTAGGLFAIVVARTGGAGGDTLASNTALIGVNIRKAS